MEPGEHSSSVAAALANADIVGEIIQRVGGSVEFFRTGAVSSTWLQSTRTPSIYSQFILRTTASNLGFLVEFSDGHGRVTRLLYAEPSQGDETADILRRSVHPDFLAQDIVLSSRDGIILVASPEVAPAVYYTTCPSQNPPVYTPVATGIPAIPLQSSSNTLGQFGVLPSAGYSGMSFFVKDPAGPFTSTYEGVSFCSTTDVFYHVCVFRDGEWNRFVSAPIPSPEPAVFHRNPYSVLGGDKLYMMYVLGYIVSFDIPTSTFSVIELPTDCNVRSCHDYTVAPHSGGAVVLVHYHKGTIDTWVLSHLQDSLEWIPESNLDLVWKTEGRISSWSWDRVLSLENSRIGQDCHFSVQLRCASPNARQVFLTFSFEDGMFEVDMNLGCVREVNIAQRPGRMGRVYTLSEKWPPIQSN
jgi:hypothetical protein